MVTLFQRSDWNIEFEPEWDGVAYRFISPGNSPSNKKGTDRTQFPGKFQ